MKSSVKVYIPPWAKQGCKVTNTIDKQFMSGTAKGVATWVYYKDSKGKDQSMIKWVKWI